MITGQYPRREWRENADGRIRTLAEAVAVARSHGVLIPDDVEFHIDEVGDLNRDCVARGPRVDRISGERVFWSALVHDRTGKVPFRIWSGLLKSDEAIVAGLSHEMHELQSLRPILQSDGMLIDDLIANTEPGRPGNLHDQAWDVADANVDRMRGVQSS
jgi:hypothetical protein